MGVKQSAIITSNSENGPASRYQGALLLPGRELGLVHYSLVKK